MNKMIPEYIVELLANTFALNVVSKSFGETANAFTRWGDCLASSTARPWFMFRLWLSDWWNNE